MIPDLADPRNDGRAAAQAGTVSQALRHVLEMSDDGVLDDAGTRLIRGCLLKSVEANPEDSPFGTSPDEATAWHADRATAFRWALATLGHDAAT